MEACHTRWLDTLENLNPESAEPPADWKTGHYHPILKHRQKCVEKFKTEMENANITNYSGSDETLHNREIDWTFMHMPWMELNPDYSGDIPQLLFHYLTLEEAKGLRTKGLHTAAARHSQSPHDLLSATWRWDENCATSELYAMCIKLDLWPIPYPAYGSILQVLSKSDAETVKEAWFRLVIIPIT